MGFSLTPAVRAAFAALVLVIAGMLALAGSATAAVTQKQAAKKALAALGTSKRSDPVIVFGLPSPVRAGTKITQAGTTEPTDGSTKGLTGKLRSAGVRTVNAPSVLTVGAKSYFFYEDRAPFQMYQHAGKVAIVDAETGRVRVSRTITWPPLLNGRLPAFLKTAAGYRSSKYQVLYRPWTISGGAQQPRVANRNVFDLDPFGPGRPLPDMSNGKAIADRLAAERSCVLRVTDTLPTFWNVNQLNLTRSYVGTLFEAIERQNAGFVDDRYGARSGESLGEAVDRLVSAGCKDVLLYIAGQGYDEDGEPVVQLGTSVLKGGLLAQQNVSASDLRELVSARPGVTFKFKFDAPYSGGFIDRLKDLTNVLLVETPAAEGDPAFSFIPNVSQNGQMVSGDTNVAGLLEFTNCELVGFKSFFESATEIDKATQAQIEGVSFLVEMLARSQELCRGVGFADDLGMAPQLYAAKRGSGKGTNLPPNANPQDVTVTEDTPKNITLGATDPDGDPLTFTITKDPEHGTLSGSGGTRTYTPNSNYVGPDDFSFKAIDDNGAESNTAKVSITVVPGNDAPIVTNSSGSNTYTEQNATATKVDTALTVSDIDDTQLNGATVKVSSGFQSGDALVFADQLGITGTYNSGTGVLTLTGAASVSDYQTALRDVGFRNTTNDNPSSPKTIEFKVNDGDTDSAASTKNVSITPVNDNPVLDTTDTALAYNENATTAVDNGITATDVDSANLTGATVQITANHVQAEDTLAFTNQSGITHSYNDSTGTLTLTGSATVAQYQTALRSVTYNNNSDTPSTATRTVSFRVDDGSASQNLSNVATRDITVNPVDDAPTANDDSTSMAEDPGAQPIDVLANDTDVDGGPKTISSASDPANGTVVLTGGSPGAHSGLTYQPDPNYCSATADTFTYTVNGGDTATVSVTVTCVNDRPVLDTTDAALVYSEQSTVAVDNGITATDVDSPNLTGATVQITGNHVQAEDTLAFTNAPPISGSYDDSTGTLTLTGSATVAQYQTALRSVTYNNNSDTPNTATRTVSFQANDGAAANNLSLVATRDITINAVNDAPVANDDTATVNEDSSGAGNDIAALSNDTDAEGDAIEVTNVSDPANGTATIVQGSPDKVNYQPDANYCNNPPGTTPDTFTYTVNGGDTATVSVTVNCADDPPVANDDTATVNEDSTNNSLTVVSNDTDVESDQVEITNVSDPANGTTTIVQGSPDTIQYTPDANYCNNPPGTTPDTFTYTVNGGDTATVSVTVTCVDDAPVANDDTKTVTEDSSGAGNNITVLSNDTDVDAGPMEITNVSDPANGTATIVQGSPDEVNYVPDANYCNNPPGTTLDTFTYTVTGGDTATVTVTVDCVDDAPVAVNDGPVTVAEDSLATTIDVLANDTDVDGGAKTIQSKTNGSNGATVTITNGGADLTYQPAANFCGSDSFTYTLNGGSSGTVSVTVTCANDAPVVDLNGEANPGINTTVTFNEVVAGTGNPTTVAPSLDTSDVDDTHLEGATIVLTNEQNVGQESLSIDQALATSKGIAVSVAANLDSITLTSNAPNTVTKQDYEDVLRTVKYDNNALVLTASPDRVIEFKVNDGSLDSVIATATVQVVPLNVPPTLDLNGGGGGENEAVTFTEGSGAVQLAPNATTSDADDTHYSQATITLTNQQNGSAEVLNVSNASALCVQVANNNSQAITLSGNCTSGDYQTVIRTATYNNTSDTPTTSPSRSVEFKVNDGIDNSPTRTSTVTVQATNDPPVNTVPVATQTLTEDGSKTFSSANSNQISVNDVDAGTNPIKVTLSVTNGTLTLNGTTGLTFTPPADGTSDQTMTFTGSQSDINAALNGLIYTPNSNYNGADTLSITTDDQGNTGGAAQTDGPDTVGLTINAVNDGPTNTVPPATQEVDEDTTLTFSSGNGNQVSIADPDSGSSDVRVTLGVSSNGRLTLATTAGLNFACSGCSGNGTSNASMVFEGTVAEVNAALNGMTYKGIQDFNGSDTLSITTNDLGNTGAGGALSDGPDTVAITVKPVNDAPTADNETFGGPGNLNDQAHGNTTMQVDDPSDDKSAPTNPHTEISGDILDGDSDVDGPGPLIVQSAGSDGGATNGQTADGGTVTIEQDGDFVYQPPAEVSCDNGTDSFNYKISDQASSGAGPIPGTAIGTVTIHLEGCVWYVSNNAPGNVGTSTAPFDTLAQAETKSGANHTVFVFDGDNTSTGYQTGYAMNSGERLIGEHEGLTVDPDQGGSMTADVLHPANPGAHPTIAGTNEDVIDLDDGNEVRGFNIDPAGTGSGIAGSAGDTGGATIDDVNIVDTAVAGSQPGLELDGTTGTFNISNLVVNNLAATSPPNTATGVRVNSAGTVNFDPASQVSITTTGAKGLEAVSTGLGTSTFDDITVSGSGVGGVRLDTTTGTVALGDGTGSDLSLTTTGGSDAAFRVNNHTGGTLTVDSAGTDDLHATGGPAVDVTNTSGPTLSFDDVDSTDSVNDAINLDGLGTGTFSATSGDIKGEDGIAFDLNGGTAPQNGAITYPGSIGDVGAGTNDGSGTTVIEVTNRSGGVVSLSGSIEDDNDAGGGVNVSGNTGGSTVLSGATKQFNTGASDGVSFTSSDGHTLVFSGGGLDIDTTSGNGLVATTSGTLQVSTGVGTPNTLDSTALSSSNRGLNISDTDIAAADVTFQRIRTDGGANGVLLNNTGTAGNLDITGAGGTCTNADTSGCSGGEIENTTGANTSSDTPTGSGIALNNTDNVALTRVWVHDHSNYGIRGADVDGFTLANSTINGTNGDDGANNDGSVVFDDFNSSGTGLTGSASVTNTHIQGGAENNFGLSNDSGTLNRLTIDSVTTGANSTTLGNAGIDLEGLGSATLNATVKNTAITSARAHTFGFTANGSGGGDLDFYNNAISNNHPSQISGAGATLFRGGMRGGTVSIDVSNGGIGDNTFRDAKGTAVIFEKNIDTADASAPDATFNATLDNADIGLAGTANSGSTQGSGVKIEHEGDGILNATVTNNEVRQYNNFGIQFEAGDGVIRNGTFNINATNNTVANPGTAGLGNFQGISLNNGASGPTENFQTCWNLRNNSFSNSGVGSGFDLRLRSRGSGTVKIAGATLANSTDDAGVAAYSHSVNTFVDDTVARGDTGTWSGSASTTCP